MHTQPGIKERFVADVKAAAATMRAKPSQKLEGRVSAMSSQSAFEIRSYVL